MEGVLGQGADVAERGEGQGSWEITYNQQVSKYIEDNGFLDSLLEKVSTNEKTRMKLVF